eukprot:SAG11_NODE_672_length_7812_cov_6.956308_5_plen_48_part_00
MVVAFNIQRWWGPFFRILRVKPIIISHTDVISNVWFHTHMQSKIENN